MINWFINISFIWQALIATFFTFLVTSMGAAIIFLFKNITNKLMESMLGLSAGVMLASSFFSMLNPAIIVCEEFNLIPWLVVFIGFFLGGIFLFISDRIFNNIFSLEKKKMIMFVSSITIHNIPEGLVIGVAFGSVYYGIDGATLLSAIMLSIGIALQNFPEGSAVSIPLIKDGISKKKAFIIGSLSAIVEPIFGVIGAILVIRIRILLPLFLSFAAGTMIYVVIKELIPDSQNDDNNNLVSLYTIIGFSIMMILDVALG